MVTSILSVTQEHKMFGIKILRGNPDRITSMRLAIVERRRTDVESGVPGIETDGLVLLINK